MDGEHEDFLFATETSAMESSALTYFGHIRASFPLASESLHRTALERGKKRMSKTKYRRQKSKLTLQWVMTRESVETFFSSCHALLSGAQKHTPISLRGQHTAQNLFVSDTGEDSTSSDRVFSPWLVSLPLVVRF